MRQETLPDMPPEIPPRRWTLHAVFDCSELEADELTELLIASLPLGSSVDLEPEVDDAALFEPYPADIFSEENLRKPLGQ